MPRFRQVVRRFEPSWRRNRTWNMYDDYQCSSSRRNEGAILRYPYGQVPGNIARKIRVELPGPPYFTERMWSFRQRWWVGSWRRLAKLRKIS